MADFDATVALQSKGVQPDDIVAPLKAYSDAMMGANYAANAALTNVKTQDDAASLAARQKTAALSQYMPLDKAAAQGGMAVDPTSMGQTLTNSQTTRKLGALDQYTASNGTDPGALAAAGPEAVGQGYQAQGFQAQAAKAQQDIQNQAIDMRGRIANGFRAAGYTDKAWGAAISQARNANIIGDLDVQAAMKMSQEQRMAVAQTWIGAGSTSVKSSGMEAGAEQLAKERATLHTVAPGDSVAAGPDYMNSLGGGGSQGSPQAQPPATSGRSASTLGGMGGAAAPAGSALTPVAPAPGTGSRPIAGGFTGSGGGAVNPGWIDQATPQQMQQPPFMAQAANRYNLPADYLPRTAQIESGGRANASNPSGAAGLFQFMPSTWKQYGNGGSPMDPVASTDAAARLAADNASTLSRTLGRPPTSAELYLAHQQGAGGAAALLANPNAKAADIVGAKAVISNGGTPGMTAGQFAGMWEKRFSGSTGGNFSVSGPSPMGQGVAMPTMALGGASSGPYGALGQGPALEQPSAGPATLSTPPATPTPPIPTPDSSLRVNQVPIKHDPPTSDDTASSSMGRSAASLPPTQAPITAAAQPALTTVAQGMTPFQLAKAHADADRASQQEGQASEQFRAANAAQTGLMQLQDDLTKITPGQNSTVLDNFMAPGSGAEGRLAFAKRVNSIASVGGLGPVFDPDKIASAESAQKVTGRLGFDLAGGLGKGEAGYIVNQAVGLNPSIMSTPKGAKVLIGSLMATQQRQKDAYLFQQQFKDNNGGNPLGWDVMFDQNHPPMSYVQDAKDLARVPPVAIKHLQANPDSENINQFNQVYGSGLARYYLGSRTQ